MKRRIYYGWIVVAVSFVTVGLVSPIGTTFQLFYHALKEQYHWSHASISGIFGAHQVLNGAASPFVGWLLDRYGPRRVMPIGALILGLGLALSSQVTALWQLYVTFGVIAALGVAMLQSVPNTLIVSNWFIRNRGTAIGIVLAGTGIGQLWLMPVTQWLILRLGWRATYLVFAPVVAVVVGTLILLFQHQKPGDIGLLPYGESEDDKREQSHEVIVIDQKWMDTLWTPGLAVRTYRFWAMAMVTFAISLGFFLISPQLFVLTQEHPEFQRNSVLVALILGTGGLHKGWSKFAGGIVSDRLGREKTMSLSVGLIIIGVYMLHLVPQHPSAGLFFVAVFLFGTGYGFGLPAMIAAYADLFHGPRFGSILGSLTFVGLMGAALGASLGGYLRDLTGSYEANFMIAAISFLMAAGFMWSARPSGVRVVRRVNQVSNERGEPSMAREARSID